MTPPVENASNRAYRFIKEIISQDRWIPGQKITYDELAKNIQMSKTPIVNALNRLEQEEFVVSIPNRGFFVKKVDLAEVAELFSIREALELLAVEGAIRNYSPKLFKEIEKAWVTHRDFNFTAPTRHRWSLDIALHLKIAEMAQNRNLAKILKYVTELIYLRHRIEGASLKRLGETPKEHLRILEAIRKKNLGRAKVLMKKHIRAGMASTIRTIEKAAQEFELHF